MKTINYKGKGEHSVNELELIIEQQAEELHLLKSGQKQLSIHDVVVSETELCDNPHCEDGVVDRDMYGHPIYCQVCDKHN